MKNLWQKSFLLLIFCFLYLPIMVLVVYSFNDARYSLQWHGATLQWYQELLTDAVLWRAFLNSFFLGFLSALIATIMGLLSTIHLFLWSSNKKHNLYKVIFLLIIIPDIVLGVALLVLFNFLSLKLGFFSLLIAHITFCLPFVMLTINARIYTLDPNVYFSALDLGATAVTAHKKILFPLLWPAILSAFLLSFTLSFDDVIISYFVSGPDYSILPLTIFALVRTGVTPELNALCSFTLLFSILLVGCAHFFSRRDL